MVSKLLMLNNVDDDNLSEFSKSLIVIVPECSMQQKEANT